MYEELRKKAEKKMKLKWDSLSIGITFACTAVVLIMLSIYLPSIIYGCCFPYRLWYGIRHLYIPCFFIYLLPGHFQQSGERKKSKKMIKLYQGKKASTY